MTAPRASPLYEPVAGVPDLLAAPVTLLGDPLVLFVFVAVGYWRAPPVAETPRRAFATLVGVGLASAGLTLALKGAFALSRPPGAAAAGYGFPSGHALGAAAVYGAAALALALTSPRRALAAAGVCGAAAFVSARGQAAAAVVTGGAAGAALAPDGVGEAPLPVRLVVPALAVVVGIGGVLAATDPPLAVSLLGGGAMLWGVVALPRVAKKR